MYGTRLRRKIPSMLFLLTQPLAAVHDEDAMRAGAQIRLLPPAPQHAALLGRIRGRRDARLTRRAAHA
jgi:hypothetical protein